MRTTALTVLSLAAAYLVFIGMLSLVDRRRAYRFFRQFAQSIRANLVEMTCRFAVGAALLEVANSLPAAAAFRALGLVLCASAVILALMPEFHRRFADRVIPAIERAIPIVGFAALGMGLGLGVLVARLIAAPASPY